MLLNRLSLNPPRRLNHPSDDPHGTFNAHNSSLFDDSRVTVNQLILSQGDVLEVTVNEKENERHRRAPPPNDPPSDADGQG